MTCAICGVGPVTGVHRDRQDRPVHFFCVRRLALLNATAEGIKATATPVLPRRQSTRRVRR